MLDGELDLGILVVERGFGRFISLSQRFGRCELDTAIGTYDLSLRDFRFGFLASSQDWASARCQDGYENGEYRSIREPKQIKLAISDQLCPLQLRDSFRSRSIASALIRYVHRETNEVNEKQGVGAGFNR